MTLIAFLAEEFIVRLIDWFAGGLAGYLIGRGGKGRSVGIAIAVLYGVAVVGSFLGEGRPEIAGPILAMVAFAAMLWWGMRRSRVTLRASNPRRTG